MRQARLAVHRCSLLVVIGLIAGMFLFSQSLFAQGKTEVSPIQVPNPATDLWRAIRQGQTGEVLNPGSNQSRLIVGIPREECQKAGNCTEQAVGFSLPIHARVPGISEPSGVGTTNETLGFVLVVFGGLLIAGVVFVVRLSRGGENDAVETIGESR